MITKRTMKETEKYQNYTMGQVVRELQEELPVHQDHTKYEVAMITKRTLTVIGIIAFLLAMATISAIWN